MPAAVPQAGGGASQIEGVACEWCDREVVWRVRGIRDGPPPPPARPPRSWCWSSSACPSLACLRPRRRSPPTASPTASPPRAPARTTCSATSTSRTGCSVTSRAMPRSPARRSAKTNDAARRHQRRPATGAQGDPPGQRRRCGQGPGAPRRPTGHSCSSWIPTLDVLEQEIEQGAEELDARRAALGARLADAYRTQNTSLLEQVIDSGSFTDVLSDASAYLAYGDQDAQMATRDRATTRRRSTPCAPSPRPPDIAPTSCAGRPRTRRSTCMPRRPRSPRPRPSSTGWRRRPRRIQRRQLAKAHKIAANQRQARAYIRRHQAAERKLKNQIAGLLRAGAAQGKPRRPVALGRRQRQRPLRVAGRRAP